MLDIVLIILASFLLWSIFNDTPPPGA